MTPAMRVLERENAGCAALAEPPVAGTGLAPRLERQVGELARSFGDRLESVLFCPLPGDEGTFVFVFRDGVGAFLDLVAEVHARLSGGMVRCLRRSELFELSLTGMFIPPVVFNAQAYLVYWLARRGSVLHGADLRGELTWPAAPRLPAHLRACRKYFRSHGLLRWLLAGDYATLIEEVEREMRHLMTTALLDLDDGEPRPDTAARRFAARWPDPRPLADWRRLVSLRARFDGRGRAAARRAALEAAWLFERFLDQLSHPSP